LLRFIFCLSLQSAFGLEGLAFPAAFERRLTEDEVASSMEDRRDSEKSSCRAGRFVGCFDSRESLPCDECGALR
jgi:hypothetical protein